LRIFKRTKGGRMKRKIIGLIVVAMILAVSVVIPALAQPPVCMWSGAVIFDGSFVSDGTTIRAKVGTTQVGTGTTSGGSYSLLVAQEGGVPAEGASVSFYVVISAVEYLGGTSTWNAGGLKTLNLAATSTQVCQDNCAVAIGFASIYSYTVILYSYRQGQGVAGWTQYSPDWAITHPEWNTLTTLYKGRGYWMRVDQSCTLNYGENTYQLDGGWNLLGWLGCS
jgi:hypothetical protein